MKKLIFVYGTLKSNHGNHRVIKDSTTKFLGNIKTPPVYTLLDGGFPVVERDGDTAITGELYEVNDNNVLRRVYALEGYSGTPGKHNRFYDVDTFETEHGTAEIFVMDKGKWHGSSVIKSGNWH